MRDPRILPVDVPHSLVKILLERVILFMAGPKNIFERVAKVEVVLLCEVNGL